MVAWNGLLRRARGKSANGQQSARRKLPVRQPISGLLADGCRSRTGSPRRRSSALLRREPRDRPECPESRRASGPTAGPAYCAADDGSARSAKRAAAQAAMSHRTFDFGACFTAIGIMVTISDVGYMTNSLCSDIQCESQAWRSVRGKRSGVLLAGYSVR